MSSRWNRRVVFIALSTAVFIYGLPSPASDSPSTFVIAVSLPKPEIHAGDDLVILEVTSNPTDHTVYIGNGPNVGYVLELLNDKGEDIGLHAMGSPSKNIDNGIILSSDRLSLAPGTNTKFRWKFKPEPGYLLPGVYKLSMHARDMQSKREVYSGTIVLTVLP